MPAGLAQRLKPVIEAGLFAALKRCATQKLCVNQNSVSSKTLRHPKLCAIQEPLRKLGFSSHSERVRHTIDVIEPGGNQRNLQDCLVLESRHV